MKKIKCLDCETEFISDSKEDVLNQMMPHYMDSHSEMMKEGTEESKKEWFERFDKNWGEAEQI